MSAKQQNYDFLEAERKLLAGPVVLPQLCCASEAVFAENGSFSFPRCCLQRILVQWLSVPGNRVRSIYACWHRRESGNVSRKEQHEGSGVAR